MNQAQLENAIDIANQLRVMFVTVDADDLQALPQSDLSHLIGLWAGLACDLCKALDPVESEKPACPT